MPEQFTLADLNTRIKQLCDEKGYNYTTLSQKSGVPLTTLMNIVNGNTKNPGVITVLQLCKGLEITPKDFFDIK